MYHLGRDVQDGVYRKKKHVYCYFLGLINHVLVNFTLYAVFCSLILFDKGKRKES